MSNFTFLTEEQCFGKDKLDILKKRGTKAALTDFSILLGAYVSDSHIDNDSSLEGRTGYYWTKSDDGDNDARGVSASGARDNYDVDDRTNGARPALPFSSIDGKNIYVDPDYFEKLSESDRLFTIAHEIMHIKFMHMYRLTDSDGNRRDFDVWNTATDAIINANLERDGFTIKEGYVNMPEALNYSAEEFYQILLQEKEKKQNEQNNDQNQEQNNKQDDRQNPEQDNEQNNAQGNGENQEQDNEQNNRQENEEKSKQNSQNSEQNENQNSDENRNQGDDHSLWEEAFEKQQQNSSEREKSQKQQNDSKEQQEQTEEEQTHVDFDEKAEFEDNRKEKREKFKSRREKTEKEIRGTEQGTIKLGNIGESKEEIDWRVLTRREIEKSETIWSQRRSIAENNYAYRLEENDIEDDAETEVMIDVSGSVNLELVKAFLRQLKPLLKQSKLRVGCFNERFWGLVDIKNVRDIDNFTIPQEARGCSARTEDWDLAVRSFTKKREINKIVFTDGYPGPGNMPKEDLKKENVIWLVYGNKDFKPCCGKVINITEKQLEQLHQINKDSMVEDISR